MPRTGSPVVVELGPGTGAFVNADATDLATVLAQRGLSQADIVVSGLPWAAFSEHHQLDLLSTVVAALPTDGVFTTFAEELAMPTSVNRQTVDLSAYPDLLVLYLGMRVNHLYGIRTFFSFGRKISQSVADKPDGLLLHEPVYYSFFPMNMGMRQYWRDLPSLLAFARSEPHRQWWLTFLQDSGGTGFWHETYSVRGGIEAVYDDVPKPLGLGRFAGLRRARGPMFGSAARLGRSDSGNPAISETELYGS